MKNQFHTEKSTDSADEWSDIDDGQDSLQTKRSELSKHDQQGFTSEENETGDEWSDVNEEDALQEQQDEYESSGLDLISEENEFIKGIMICLDHISLQKRELFALEKNFFSSKGHSEVARQVFITGRENYKESILCGYEEIESIFESNNSAILSLDAVNNELYQKFRNVYAQYTASKMIDTDYIKDMETSRGLPYGKISNVLSNTDINQGLSEIKVRSILSEIESFKKDIENKKKFLFELERDFLNGIGHSDLAIGAFRKVWTTYRQSVLDGYEQVGNIFKSNRPLLNLNSANGALYQKLNDEYRQYITSEDTDEIPSMDKFLKTPVHLSGADIRKGLFEIKIRSKFSEANTLEEEIVEEKSFLLKLENIFFAGSNLSEDEKQQFCAQRENYVRSILNKYQTIGAILISIRENFAEYSKTGGEVAEFSKAFHKVINQWNKSKELDCSHIRKIDLLLKEMNTSGDSENNVTKEYKVEAVITEKRSVVHKENERAGFFVDNKLKVDQAARKEDDTPQAITAHKIAF